MCGICGCTEDHHDLDHHTDHMHDHEHDHDHLVHVEQDILSKNKHHALNNQAYLNKKNILALNIMSSPGSGKTTLLTRTIKDLITTFPISVVVGDQQTEKDAEMIRTSGVEAIQINTGRVCHLDAHRVGHAMEELSLKNHSLFFIENIGNLVCPAMFDLGEHYKVVILSVTEGDNKPIKYPDMFRQADLMLITKTDLLPYISFDVQQCIDYAKQINQNIEVVCLSAVKGDGLPRWYEWLKDKHKSVLSAN